MAFNSKYPLYLSYLGGIFLVLVMTLAFDISHIDHISDNEFYEDIEVKISELQKKVQTQLSEPLVLELIQKENLKDQDLHKVKELEHHFILNGISAQIKKKGQLIYWSTRDQQPQFCKDFKDPGYDYSICYSPFDNSGNSENRFLSKHDLKRAFSINDQGHAIHGVKIKAGKCFRSLIQELCLLSLYGLIIFCTIGICMKYDILWPMIIISILHLIGINVGFFDNYSLFNNNASYFDTFQYTPVDLAMSGSLIFCFILILTRRTYESSKRKGISNTHLLVFTLFNLLLFISHIRLIQFFTDSDRLDLNLDDLSQINASSIIFLIVVVLLQLGIFYYSTSLGELFKLRSKAWYQRYLIYAVSIVTMVGVSFLIRIEIDPLLLIVFLTAYTLLLDLFVDVRVKTITWIIWWAIFFGTYLSAVFFNYNLKNDISQRLEFLKDSFHQTPTTVLNNLKDQNISRRSTALLGQVLTLPSQADYDQRDLEDYLSHELSIDDLGIQLYDENKISLFDEQSMNEALQPLLKVDSTTYFDEVKNEVWLTGKINEIYCLVRIGPEDKKVIANSHNFNYYRKGKAIYQLQDIKREIIDKSLTSSADTWKEGSDIYVAYRPSSDRLLLSKRTFPGFVKPITLFSFLFCLIIICILVLGLLHLVFEYLPDNWPLFIEKLESLNSKIQIALILVILLSFLVIASITSSFLENYVANDRAEVLYSKIASLEKEIQKRSSSSSTSSETVEVLLNYKDEIEDIHNVKMDIISRTDLPQNVDYFTNAYFNKQDKPRAFSLSDNENESTSYLPIFLGDKASSIAGLVKVTHGKILSMDRLSIFDFLGSIFNIYVFLFLIASVLAIFMAQSITRPLSVLNQKLSQVRLGTDNDPITWDRDDEIGVLIRNYNNMINKLGESAELLAKKERDSAWREMAKQVAHEIKNPLTPMKLSIQYLERAIAKDPTNAKPIAKKISATMLEQIDNLTGIAEAFSNFAELPQTSNVRIELNSIVEMVYNLFKKRDDMDIKLSIPIDPIEVYGDKGQLVRILNNLVKNATESIPEDRRGQIVINLKEVNDKAIISVLDNGTGIPENQKDKIFQPKFTTKDSGSGLGLAIAANMIESMNGKIYFDSTIGESTCFYIEMNTIRYVPAPATGERIPLE